jgi:hypothetical protein
MTIRGTADEARASKLPEPTNGAATNICRSCAGSAASVQVGPRLSAANGAHGGVRRRLLVASRSVTVSTLAPDCSAIPDADQLVRPEAVPVPPRSLAHEVWVTPTLSAALPLIVGNQELVLVGYVGVDVGAVIARVGAMVQVVSRRRWFRRARP